MTTTTPSGVSVSVTTPPAAQIKAGLPSKLAAALPSDLAASVSEVATSGPSGMSETASGGPSGVSVTVQE